MTEQEISKLLTKKQKELQELQQELHILKYEKQIKALFASIQSNENVVAIINDHNLNCEDCRYLGEQIAKNFETTYELYADGITKKQAQRERKRNNRRASAQRKKEDVVDDFIDRLLNETTSSTADTHDVSGVNINTSSPVTVEETGRTY